jgi:hypothetical protein
MGLHLAYFSRFQVVIVLQEPEEFKMILMGVLWLVRC